MVYAVISNITSQMGKHCAIRHMVSSCGLQVDLGPKIKRKIIFILFSNKKIKRHLLKYEDIFKTSTFLKYNYFYSINMISLQMGELCLSCNICELNIFTLDCYFYTPAK